MKVCRKCFLEKSFDEYYKHSQMLDGYLNICKSCVKSRTRAYREINIKKIREYDRKRSLKPERKLLNILTTKRIRQEREGYNKSHTALYRAVESGKIVKSNICQVCGRDGRVEAHHEDYKQSEEVIWLCPSCHKQYHLGKTERSEKIREIIKSLWNFKRLNHEETS